MPFWRDTKFNCSNNTETNLTELLSVWTETSKSSWNPKTQGTVQRRKDCWRKKTPPQSDIKLNKWGLYLNSWETDCGDDVIMTQMLAALRTLTSKQLHAVTLNWIQQHVIISTEIHLITSAVWNILMVMPNTQTQTNKRTHACTHTRTHTHTV